MALKYASTLSSLETTITDLKSQVKSANSLPDKANNAIKKMSAEMAKLGKK